VAKKLSGKLFDQDFPENVWWGVLKIKGGEQNPQVQIKIFFFLSRGLRVPREAGYNRDPAYSQPGASAKASDASSAFAERLVVSLKKSQALKMPPRSPSLGTEGPGAASTGISLSQVLGAGG